MDQNIRAGVNYNYAFEPLRIEPFQKNDSLFTGNYWKILKDFNFNLLPSSFSVNTDINRQFNKQKFREVELEELILVLKNCLEEIIPSIFNMPSIIT